VVGAEEVIAAEVEGKDVDGKLRRTG